jgi:hypothetical protein
METPLPMRTVGRRKTDSLRQFTFVQNVSGALARDVCGLPKGVFRYHSFAEADAWKMTQIAKKLANRR